MRPLCVENGNLPENVVDTHPRACTNDAYFWSSHYWKERRGRGERRGVLISCIAVELTPQALLVSLQCWDRGRRVFTDQADIACTKLEAP